MYNVGVFNGKFLPVHRGHINAIIHAATLAKKLYVVISDNAIAYANICIRDGVKPMPLKLRAKWLSIELQGFSHIKVLMLDETDIPLYPLGFEVWSERLKNLIPEHIDALFGGEKEYEELNKKYFPDADYILYDPGREQYSISATEIRRNPMKHWDYILGSVRPFFAKKFLIAGTESCGKTTITKYLAKLYHTSWAEEEGRYYSSKYLGGNEEVFEVSDFFEIAHLQHELDKKALHDANKVVFFDSDAVVTQFYCELYTGERNKPLEYFINPDKYDYVLLFKPDVEWVDDGLRFNSETKKRFALHKKLKELYIEYGFGEKIIEIEGNYSERLEKTLSIVDKAISQ
jgi:HTH-type transcriptional repressor of NAD biosynthesis genes